MVEVRAADVCMAAEGFVLLGYFEQILFVLQDVRDVSP
jgi:hypothetical protein